jgi:16S rRNA (guanine527-N7)-methyltransferase
MSEFYEILKKNTGLSDEVIGKLYAFNELLYEKNEVMNLTRIKKKESVYRNFLDSLNPIALRSLADAKSIIDIGSGSGFPAMALAIAYPEKKITMVEATGKKADFLKEAIQALGLRNAKVVSARAEELAHDAAHREKYDAVTARAVAAMRIVCEFCAGFARTGGKLIFYKGMKAEEEIAEAKKVFAMLGLAGCAAVKYQISSEDDATYMVELQKSKPIGKAYPRAFAKIKKG